jgi:hypothetical protein
MKLLGLTLAALLGVACSNGDPPCPCRGYVWCYYATGGTPGSIDATYGANGSCWQTSATSNACCAACQQSAMNFDPNVAKDAGCDPFASSAQ